MTPEQVKELVERLRSRKRVVAIGEDKHDAAKYTAQMAEDDGAAISALSLLAQEREELRGALLAAEAVISEIAGASWGTVADVPMAHRHLTIGRAEAYLAAQESGEGST